MIILSHPQQHTWFVPWSYERDCLSDRSDRGLKGVGPPVKVSFKCVPEIIIIITNANKINDSIGFLIN